LHFEYLVFKKQGCFLLIALDHLTAALTWSPAEAMLGPRQVGKTTLACSLLESQAQAFSVLL
jgi:predicted AAA+ superfamily ATPase